MYEDSIRVPLVVKAPKSAPSAALAGTRRPQLTQHLDLAATILDYAGLGESFGSGRTMRPTLEHPGAAGRSEVFCEFNGNSGRGFQQRAMITPQHKYIHNHGYAAELYDLQADPMELDNLCQHAPNHPQAIAMRRRLRQWMMESEDCIEVAPA
jgi:arylsulfatase A-like enzyme